ncbi:cation:proton antiporter [Aeromicrobium sp. PE09-221]|uniref:monovalent cation/H+ antiporter subunit D family protein n=1 Tax=Aeromicrobium sp. PE09-221 TaxID=1898043 RepID=UPI000B3EB9A6|nr:monovalent cation/H+ antiporter subunit D family protein [Aeromicrobium sp. PE09-221]OUZ06839.1 cation:proton antiporter [Aeromicrobium sp. PE09-221]
MSPELLPLFVGAPLLAAGLTAFAGEGRRWPVAVLFPMLIAQLAGAGWLISATRDGEVLAHGVGGWVPGIAIPFAGDMLAALMLLFTGFLSVMCSWYAVAAGVGRLRLFAPLVLALTAGVNGALLTADLFNLFVFIEVMLLPSYGLLVLASRGRGTVRSVTGSRLYVTFNLFVSTLFLAGVGLVYGTAGTVNLGELAGVAQADGRTAIGAGVALAALMMKAATVPTHGWLARAYPSTSPAVTALFSGLHTKVAIYAIYRLYAVLFDGDQRWLVIGLVIFSLTMAIGVLGAVGEQTTRSILAFHMVSQIGYILVGVGLFTVAGLAAGLFYLLHHMVVKASLFLSTGAVEDTYGSNRLDELRGIGRREPAIAAAFAVAALSLAGLPPFSGFVAKLTLIIASIDAGQIAVAVVAVVVSLVTLQSMLKIWNNVFVSPLPEGESPRRRIGWWLAAPAVATAAVTVVLGLGAQWLLGLTEVAADGLLDTTTYVTEVLR